MVSKDKEREKEYQKNWSKNNRDKRRAIDKRYYKRHREKEKLRSKLYRETHPDKIKAYNKFYRENHYDKKIACEQNYRKKNREKLICYSREYRKTHADKISLREKQYHHRPEVITHRRERAKNYWRNNINQRLSGILSNAIYMALKGRKGNKHTMDILGYTIEELREHMETQFQKGMTWDNYGDWHIDHRIPKIWFDFSSYADEAFKECWSLDNLQPKWASDNKKKKDTFAEPTLNQIDQITTFK